MLVAVRERTGRERPISYLVKITLEKKICVDLAGKTDREKPRRMSRKLKQKTFVIIGNRTQILLLPVAHILPKGRCNCPSDYLEATSTTLVSTGYFS